MSQVLARYGLSLVAVTAAVVVGLVLAWAANTWFRPHISAIRPWAFILGVGLLLVAGIGRLGWDIQTWGGESPPERLDTWIFWILSSAGTVLLIVDYALAKSAES
jgi:hypothetical protein